MASSTITVPTTTPADLATDEIDDRHFQGVKVHGGGEGVANELHVSGAGEARITKRFFAGAHTQAIGETSYVDHALIGGPGPVGTFPGGLYSIANVLVAMIDPSGPGSPATDPLPPLLVGVVGVPAGTDVSFLTDGVDMSALPFAILKAVNFVPDAGFEAHPFGLPIKSSAPDFPVFIGSGDGSPTDVYVSAIADGAIADDLTAWSLALTAVLEARSTS